MVLNIHLKNSNGLNHMQPRMKIVHHITPCQIQCQVRFAHVVLVVDVKQVSRARLF